MTMTVALEQGKGYLTSAENPLVSNCSFLIFNFLPLPREAVHCGVQPFPGWLSLSAGPLVPVSFWENPRKKA